MGEKKGVIYNYIKVYWLMIKRTSISKLILPSVVLFFDKYYYLFNALEDKSLNIKTAESGMRLVNNVLFTHNTTDYTKDLLKSNNNKLTIMQINLKIFGLSKTDIFINHIICLKNIEFFVYEYSDFLTNSSHTIKNSLISIAPVALHLKINIRKLNSLIKAKNKKKCDKNQIKNNNKFFLTTINYVCNLVSLSRKFQSFKALAVGVLMGSLIGELQRGCPISSMSGTTIHDSEVNLTVVEGKTILIIDIPTKNHLLKLNNNCVFRKYQFIKTTKTKNYWKYCKFAPLVVHISSWNVIKAKAYQQWMSKFLQGIKHLMLCQPKHRSNGLEKHTIMKKILI